MQTSTLSSGKTGRIAYLDAARVMAIFCITMTHALNRSFENYEGAETAMMLSGQASAFRLLMCIFSRLGVPLFLMISGALVLSKKMDSGDRVKNFYRRNLLPMFITTEIWYFIMYWYIVLLSPEHRQAETDLLSLTVGMIKNQLFLDQITMGCMWYMPMIICIYMVIPLVAMCIDRLPPVAVAIPCITLYIYKMIIPSVNNYWYFMDIDRAFDIALDGSHLFSMYFLYIIAGYYISKGRLEKIPAPVIAGGLILSFAAVCFYQQHVWQLPNGYLVDYNFPGFIIIAGFMFELLRRTIRTARPALEYLSRISFGVFFTHILIMDCLRWFLLETVTDPVANTLILEGVSLAGSILVISLLSLSKPLGRLLFMLK